MITNGHELLSKNNEEISISLSTTISASLLAIQSIEHALIVLNQSRDIAKAMNLKIKEKNYRQLKNKSEGLRKELLSTSNALKNILGMEEINERVKDEVGKVFGDIYELSTQ